MAYPQPLAKLVWGGTLFENNEIWSCSLSLAPATPGAAPPTPGALAPAIATFHADPLAKIMSSSVLRWVKCNEVNAEGRYRDQSKTAFFSYPGDGIAGKNTGSIFPQLALAVSLVTARQRGPASRGRFYPPTPVMQCYFNNGKVLNEDRNGFATAAARLIRDINAAAGSWRVVVASAVNGVAEPVTHIEVGDIMDTQRRRRNILPETYLRVSAALDPGAVQPT